MSLRLAEFYNSPWVLEATVHARWQMCWSAGLWASSWGQSKFSWQWAMLRRVAARRQSQTAAQSGGGTMVLPVHGVLTNRAHAKAASTVMTSAEELGADIRAAMRDPDVGRIVLDVDSPGGGAFGVQEVGDAMYEARQTKPVIAVVNATAASGGTGLPRRPPKWCSRPAAWSAALVLTWRMSIALPSMKKRAKRSLTSTRASTRWKVTTPAP